jgi:hypothetical protein
MDVVRWYPGDRKHTLPLPPYLDSRMGTMINHPAGATTMTKLFLTAAIIAAFGLPSMARAQTAVDPAALNCRPAKTGEKPTGTLNNTQVVCSSNVTGDSAAAQKQPSSPPSAAPQKQPQVTRRSPRNTGNTAARKGPYPGWYDTSEY